MKPKKINDIQIEQGIEESSILLKIVKKNRPLNPNKERRYVNNAEFTKCVSEFADSVRGIPRNEWTVPIPKYVGECIMKLVNNYANKSNFRGYTWIEEMKGEALVTCIRYVGNFNGAKSNNAFAYFTQLIHNSFLQILRLEKVQTELRYGGVNETSTNNYNNISLKSVYSLLPKLWEKKDNIELLLE